MKATEERKWRAYIERRLEGFGVAESAAFAKMGVRTAYRFEHGDQASTGLEVAAKMGVTDIDGTPIQKPLCKEALIALEDFAFFRKRYFGRDSTPWQVDAAYEILRSIESDDREYVVMNEPPGSGKSTLFTHDIPVWLITRNRAIRIQIGSAGEKVAQGYVGRIKRTLERKVPQRASGEELDRGIAADAVATLEADFGPFKPQGRADKWQAGTIVVQQLDGTSIVDKESTVTAWGKDSTFLGERYNFIIWDDLVTRKNMKTLTSRDDTREWWDSDAETRLEPRGTLVLQGQRITTEDLYRYCLDKKNIDGTHRYKHVVYPSHDETKCTGEHDNIVKPWPHSCLLDPWRLPWKELEAKKHNNPRNFEVLYQQRDGDVPGGLAEMEWIEGGIDSDGYYAPGCLDKDRTVLEAPAHLRGDVEHWSFVSVDPSPTEWWGVIWWLYDPVTKNMHIIDIHRRRMNPEQFITWDFRANEFQGLLVGMMQDSRNLGIPITDMVFEQNAAQRWFLSTPHVQEYQRVTGLRIHPHTTSVNKNDPKYGLESIGDLFRQGRIRIPWKAAPTIRRVQILVEEVTRFPDFDTTDCAMSTWFAKLAVENLYTPRQHSAIRQARPSWMRPATRRGLSYA